MEAAMTAIETTGTVDEDHRLRLDEALPLSGPMRVRVIKRSQAPILPTSTGQECT
jgi:hypothetical protein